MRRARINTKPNFRPGSRSREQTSNGEADANTILPTISTEKTAMRAPSPQEHAPGEEPAEALGVKNDPQSSLEKSLANQHDGAPSSGSSTPAAVSQRRMRFSATPKLSRPRVTPAPRPSARTPRLAVLTRPELDSAPEATVMGSVNSNNPSDSETPQSTLPTKVAMQSSTSRPPSSPCVPSTSGLQESPVCGTASVEDFSPSPQHGQVPQQCPQKLGDHQCSTRASDLPSVCEESTCFDEPGSSEETDNDRILKTLKLKALMKIERRKDIERTKKTVRQKQEYTAVDRDKMTMRDLIYYLPNTSPMKYSRPCEEEQAEVISQPSQNVPEKTQETDEEEAESENEEMLMPKVRVAEDGSIILDEDSLTVRVQRTSNTAVVENSNPLFERGSTTTYTSFKNVRHVKSWSVRETDMLFLAISMVGTDFSLIGHLLPHRSHSEIKNKFKREEKVNAWRIDKAFRNKRPYDKEFFSFLLGRVLAKDKEKGKSIKLVMTQPRKARKARGKKTKKSVCEEECISGGDEAPDFEMEDGGQVCAGKENENVSNVSETDTALAKTKRKRTRCINEDKEDLSEEQVQRKKRKYTKKKPKGIASPHSNAEDKGGLFDLEDDAVNANKEEELESNVPAPKKKRKNSRKGGEEGEIEKPAEGRKGRRRRKSLKVSSDHESIDAVESGISDEDRSVATMKCKRSKKGVVQTGESTKGKKKANREMLKGTVNEEIDENGEASTTRSSESDKTDALIQAKAVDIPQQKTGKNSRKPKPSLCTRGRKRSTETEVAAELQEIQEQVQKEAEVVMERTPPRIKNLHSPSKLRCISKEPEPRVTPPASPAVGESSSSKQLKTRRAERAKRNLTFGKRKDHDESENDPAFKDKDSTMDETVTQESEDLVMDNTLDELKDSSYRHALDSPMFQRRPLVMLSREEVAMILSVQEQTSAEQPLPSSSSPQVSPLDLSLNTELSFQLSNLMEENSEAGAHVAEGLLDNDSQNAIFERHCEDLEISESALDQSALSSTRHVSTSLNSDMNSSLVVSKVESLCSLEKSEPQTHSKTHKEDLSSEDSACAKPNAHGTHKRTVIELPVSETHGTSSAIQDAAEANETSMELLVQESNPSPSTVLEKSQESVVEAPQTGDRPQVSIPVTPEIKEDMQGSLFEPAEVIERSLESVKATAQIRDRSQGSVLINPAIKEDMHESLLEPAEVSERSQDFVVAPLEKEGTKGSVTSTTEIKLRSEGLLMNTPVVKEDTREEVKKVAAPEMKAGSQGSVLIPETNDYSQKSLQEPAEVLKRSDETVLPEPGIMEGLQASELMTSAIKKDTQEPLLEPAEVLERSHGFVMAPLEIKEGTQRSIMSTPEVKLRCEGSSVTAPMVKEDAQEEVKVATPEMKVGSQILEIKDCSQESLREPAEILEKSLETVVQATEIVEGLQGSELMTTAMEDDSERSLLEPVGMSRKSQQLVLPEAEIMEGLQTTEMITPEMKDNSERSLLEASEVLEKSRESVVTMLEIKEGSQGALLPTSEIKEQTQGSLLEPSEVSQMPVIATPEIKERSQGSVLIIPKFKEALQGSDLELGDILERSQDFPMAAPEIEEGSQESALTNPKIKQVPEGSMVTTAIAKADTLQKEEHGILLSTKLSSGKSVSPEHGGVLKRRSRILKPKPNLNLASRIVHSTPKQKSREPNKIISSEKLLPQSPASDQHCDLDYSKESISTKKGPYLSSVGQDTESKPAVPVSSDASATEQEQNSTTVTLSAVSAPVLQLASDHTRNHCGVDSTTSCQSVADLRKLDTSYVWPLTAQTAEQERTEQMNETCRDVCTPAKVIFSGDDQSDEPTFILTLYDIPVTQANLALASNVSVVTSDLRPVEVPSQSVSTPDCTRSACLHMGFGETAKECVGILQNEQSDLLVMVTENSGENIPMDLTATLERGAGLSAETSGSPPEREGSLSKDFIKDKEPADIPRALTTHSQEQSNILSMLEEKAAPKLDPIMKIDQQDMAQATQKAITPQTKDMSKEVSAKQEAEDILSIPSKDPKLLCKEGSELDFKLKKCVKSPSQDPLDPEQCEGVSQVLADVLVPVVEKMDDNVRKESTMPEEINLHGADDSSTTLGETQEIPSEELEKMKCPTAVSNPLFSVVDSKYKPPLSEEKMTPVKRKGKLKPKLVKRPRVKNDSTKTAQPGEQNQPSLSQAIFPSQQTMVPQAKQDSGPISATKGVSDVAKFEERPEGKENLSDPPQEGVLQQMHQIIPCTVVLSKSVGPLSHGSEETEDYAGVSDVEMVDVFKPASEAMPYIAIDGKAHEEEVAGIPSQDYESTETSPCDSIQSEPALTNLPLSWQSKIHELEDMPSEKGPWLQSDDVAIKHDLRSSSKGNESSGSVEECEGVFVPISEMGGLNKDCQIPFVSIPTREVGPSKMQEKCRNVEKTEDFSKEFTKSMKQNDSFSKESKTLARGTGKQQVKRAGAKNDSPKIALHITEQNQPMSSQAISTKSHLPKVSQSYKDSSEMSTKLEKAHILDVPEVEPDSKAKQKSNLEEELRRKHEIKPCTVSISKCFDAQIKEQSPQKAKKHLEQAPSRTLTKVGTAATSCRPEMELSLEGKDDSISSQEGMCSQGCHEAKPSPKTTRSDSLSVDSKETEAEKISDMQLKRAAVSSSALTLSEDSNKPSVMEDRILESSSVSVKKKDPAKANLKPSFTKQLGKKNESSNSNLNPRMRQLPITAWAKKKSVQAAAKLETEDSSKTSEMKSSFEAKESECFEVEQQNTKLTVETSCSKAQPSDLKSCESVPIIAEVETSEDIPTMPKLNKESSEGPSGSRVKKLPARPREAKVQVKPRLLKRTCRKGEDAAAKTGQPPSTRFTSPRSQRTRASKIKETTEQHAQDLSGESKTEKINFDCVESSFLPRDSWLPKSPTLSPRIILSRVDVQTGEAGSSSSYTFASSPPKVSTSTYQPKTPPQRMTSCIVPPLRSSPPISSEDTEDEPSRVSQFFINDIFTEIDAD